MVVEEELLEELEELELEELELEDVVPVELPEPLEAELPVEVAVPDEPLVLPVEVFEATLPAEQEGNPDTGGAAVCDQEPWMAVPN